MAFVKGKLAPHSSRTVAVPLVRILILTAKCFSWRIHCLHPVFQSLQRAVPPLMEGEHRQCVVGNSFKKAVEKLRW